jgi:hypothetical protein
MTIAPADPRAQSLEEAFAEAMGAAPKPKEPPAPPEIDRDAPHGRDQNGEPLAPYGRTKDGRPKLSPAGRKPKDRDDRARLAKDTPGPPEQVLLEPRDLAAPLMAASETIWFGGSVIARIGPKFPVIGKLLPARKLAATMAVFDLERPRLVSALNLAAQHDARARRFAEKFTTDAGWALTCMFLSAPFISTVAAVWQTTGQHDALAERDLPGLDELAAVNEAALDKMFAKITERMAQAAAAGADQLATAAA